MDAMDASAYCCSICKGLEEDKTKFILCVNCCKCEHFSCKGVHGAAVDTLRQKPYFCCLECCEIAQRSVTPFPTMDNSLKEGIRDILLEVRKIQQNHVNLETKLEAKLDTLLEEMKTMKADYKSLKEEVANLQHEKNATNETVSALQMDLERINRTALAKNAIIIGVPVTKDEVVKQVVADIALAVNCRLPDDAIVEAKRIPLKDSSGKTAPIKVVFSETCHKEELFSKKRHHGLLLSSALNPSGNSVGSGTRIILRDELTTFGMKLLKEVKAVKDQAALEFVWPGRHGVILTKAHEGSKVESVKNMQDLQKICRKRQLEQSLFHSTSIDEPNSKR